MVVFQSDHLRKYDVQRDLYIDHILKCGRYEKRPPLVVVFENDHIREGGRYEKRPPLVVVSIPEYHDR